MSVFFARKEKPKGFGHLVPGRFYRIAQPFRDHDGILHPSGRRFRFLGSSFLPYEDGLVLDFSTPEGAAFPIRLQWRPNAEGAVIEALASHFVEA